MTNEAILAHPPMISDLIAGYCSSHDGGINLRYLCSNTGARFTEGRLQKLSIDKQQITRLDDRQLQGDILSIDRAGLNLEPPSAAAQFITILARRSFLSPRATHSKP